MPKPTFKEFAASARKALIELCVSEQVLAAFEEKGPSFDFENDGLIDSIEMADLAFMIDKDLDVKIGLEDMVYRDQSATLQNLYDSMRQDAKTPAE